MLKLKISERSIQRGRISWEQSQDDLAQAESFIKTEPQKSCLLSVQASINAISSVLEAQGHFQLPAFSNVELLDKCIQHFEELEKIRSQCYVLDSSLERDVMGHSKQKKPHFNVPFARTCHKSSKIVIDAVRIYWKANQS